MSNRDGTKRTKKYHRLIGMFSGGIVGLVVMAIPFLFWRSAPDGVLGVAVVVGLLGGIYAGYRFPRIADAAYEILTCFHFR